MAPTSGDTLSGARRGRERGHPSPLGLLCWVAGWSCLRRLESQSSGNGCLGWKYRHTVNYGVLLGATLIKAVLWWRPKFNALSFIVLGGKWAALSYPLPLMLLVWFIGSWVEWAACWQEGNLLCGPHLAALLNNRQERDMSILLCGGGWGGGNCNP